MSPANDAGGWLQRVSAMVSAASVPVLQLAADGKWETPVVIPVTTPSETIARRIYEVSQAADRDIAVEVLWPGEAIVGVRWNTAAWRHAATAAIRSAQAIATGAPTSPQLAVAAALQALLGFAPSSGVEFIELGAVNAWQSVGPEIVWRRGEPAPTKIAKRLTTQRPDLAECHHPLAVELATTAPQPCWVGVYVSTSASPPYSLDPRRLDDVIRLIV